MTQINEFNQFLRSDFKKIKEKRILLNYPDQWFRDKVVMNAKLYIADPDRVKGRVYKDWMKFLFGWASREYVKNPPCTERAMSYEEEKRHYADKRKKTDFIRWGELNAIQDKARKESE